MTSQIVEEQINKKLIEFEDCVMATGSAKECMRKTFRSFSQTLINATLREVEEKVIGEDEIESAGGDELNAPDVDWGACNRNKMRKSQRSQLEGMKV